MNHAFQFHARETSSIHSTYIRSGERGKMRGNEKMETLRAFDSRTLNRGEETKKRLEACSFERSDD